MTMERASNVIKPQVRALRAYSLSPHRASVKLNQNENPWDAPERIKRETLRRLEGRQWSRYPDFIPETLHQNLAKFASWEPAGVIAGNGSNELIQALLMVTLERNKRVLISEPTFALYRQVATVLGGETISVALGSDFQYDAAALLQTTAETRPDVVLICSPNNPTGAVIEEKVLRQLLELAPGLVVIDEAYHEFSEGTVVPLLREYENLVVLRTFSKAMALAAFRIGYLLAAPDLITEIRKALLPYNLNVFSQTVADVALEMYESELLPLVKMIIKERDNVFDELRNIDGLVPIESRANFIIVRSEIDPKKMFSELISRDILIRDVSSYPMLSDYFRLSVGTSEENKLLLAALKEIVRS
jgi:histidinol-phosphate aminotransferase